MKKQDELVRGCFARAADDEILFVLRAKDPAAMTTIEHWAGQRCLMGLNRPTDDKIKEALQCSIDMDKQRIERFGE